MDLLLVFSVEMPDRRSDREKDNQQNDWQEIAVDVGDETTKEEAERGQEHNPAGAANHIKRKEARVGHERHSRDDRDEGANDWEKAGQDDGLATVLLVELMCRDEMLTVEPDAVLSLKEAATETIANQYPIPSPTMAATTRTISRPAN